MKNLCFFVLFSLFCTSIIAQAPTKGTYSGPENNSGSYAPEGGPEYYTPEDGSTYYSVGDESGKCFGLCLIPGDTLKETDRVQIKPGWKEATVVEPYPSTVDITYTVKEPCTTCEFSEETSTKTKEEEVVAKPGYWKYFTTPCVWETVYDTIVVKEEVVKYIITDPELEDDKISLTIEGINEEGRCIPAQTGTETRTVEIAEECTKIEVADYIWQDEEFFIEVAAPTKRWVKRKTDENCLSADPEDCMVWCIEEVPAVTQKCVRKVKAGCPYGYEDADGYCIKRTTTPPVTKDYEVITCEREAKFEKDSNPISKVVDVKVKTLKTPASYKKVVEEAVYEVIPRQVVVQAAGIDSTYIPEEREKVTLTLDEKRVYGNITETPAEEESCTKKLCVEPQVTTIDHEPEYKTVSKIEIRKGSFTQWQEIMCPDDVNSYTIGQIQQALYTEGYAPGPIDSKIGEKTKAALIQYQKDKGLPVGHLDLKTLEALGVKH